MRIGISGASGFIGRSLTDYLRSLNHQVVPLGRGLLREDSFQNLVETLEACDVLINLAGASVNRRWTSAYKDQIRVSRIHTTSRLVSALRSALTKPKLMISASAVGYYSSQGEYDEWNEVPGKDFLAKVCREWETEAMQCPVDIRLVIIRLGVVLSGEGGAMQQMITPLLKTKISAILGSGKQSFPWIAMQDVCRAIQFLIDNEETNGVYNLVSPQLITQRYLAHALAKAYRAWATLPVPHIVIRGLLGERSSMLLQGQTVFPNKLLKAGFNFSMPTIEQVLNRPDVRTVSSLDISRYMGTWYEVARFENSFEKDLTDVSATYTLLSDGTVRVENVGYKGKVRKRAIGRAYCPDPKQPGKLKVSFFLSFYADYYVLDIDKLEYNYVLVGSSSDKYLWILSRAPCLEKEVKEKLLSSAKEKGYDITKFIFYSPN